MKISIYRKLRRFFTFSIRTGEKRVYECMSIYTRTYVNAQKEGKKKINSYTYVSYTSINVKAIFTEWFFEDFFNNKNIHI